MVVLFCHNLCLRLIFSSLSSNTVYSWYFYQLLCNFVIFLIQRNRCLNFNHFFFLQKFSMTIIPIEVMIFFFSFWTVFAIYSLILPSSAPSPSSNPTGAEISIIIDLSSHPHPPTRESIFQTQIDLDLKSKVVGHNG